VNSIVKNFLLHCPCVSLPVLPHLYPVQTATVIIPVLVSIWNITSGFMIPRDSIPSFWIWVFWLNPTQYALQSLLSIAFTATLPSAPLAAPWGAPATRGVP